MTKQELIAELSVVVSYLGGFCRNTGVDKAIIHLHEWLGKILSRAKSEPEQDKTAELVEAKNWLKGFAEHFKKYALSGKWNWGLWRPKTREEALKWYGETLDQGQGTEQHLVISGQGESERFICVTGNGPKSEWHAKLICELPTLIEKIESLIESPTNSEQGRDREEELREVLSAIQIHSDEEGINWISVDTAHIAINPKASIVKKKFIEWDEKRRQALSRHPDSSKVESLEPLKWQDVKAVKRGEFISYVALPGDVALTDYSGPSVDRNGLRSALKHIESQKYEEPLAVLAVRKNVPIMVHGPQQSCKKQWSVRLSCWRVFTGKTYAEAELKARAYLNTLPDVK
jgi:hypothetical protein